MKGPPLPPLAATSIPSLLELTQRSDGGLVFIDATEVERRFGWDELLQKARRTAVNLRELGIQSGDRIALLYPTGPEFIEAFFGAMLAGAVPVPLYPPVRLGRLEEYHRSTARMIRSVRARLVLADTQVRLLLGPSIEEARPEKGCLTLQQLPRSKASFTLTDVQSEAPALIQFSSGSTMDPKPVVLSHQQLLSQCAALLARAPAPEGAPKMGASWLPLYHDMGLIGCLLSAAYYPGWLALLPPEAFLVRPGLWLRAISRHRAFISPAPNFAYGLCVKRVKDEELAGVDLSSWRFALNGAEPISAATQAAFIARFSRWGFREDAMVPVYGLSEATLAVTFAPPRAAPRVLELEAGELAREGRALAVRDSETSSRTKVVRDGTRRLVSLGVPVPGAEVQVRDGLGNEVQDGRVGRVWVQSPSVMQGYFGQQEATEAALQEGWLDTGDLGFISSGELFLTGRAKDLVIIRGANHSPQTFEEALLTVDGLRVGCSVALGFTPEEGQGEALLLLCERAKAEAHDSEVEAQVRSAVLAATGIRPHTVRLLAPGTLPRTSSGKLRRREALQRFLSGTLSAPRQVSAFGVAVEVARSALAHRRARQPPRE